MASTYHFEFLDRPRRRLSPTQIEALQAALRATGARCFDPLPEYQCFSRAPDALDDKVLVIAWTEDRQIAGFASAVRLSVPGVRYVLHLGLTCVDPDHRSARLTHRLMSRLVVGFLARRPWADVWVTNVACVLSSIGNVARNFDDVYPAPGGPDVPSLIHQRIARAIDAAHREDIYILPEATLDPATYVFRGSVAGTPFEKGADDTQYHHRDPELNAFYAQRLNFEDGDEQLQIGRYNAGTLLRYSLRHARPARGARAA